MHNNNNNNKLLLEAPQQRDLPNVNPWFVGSGSLHQAIAMYRASLEATGGKAAVVSYDLRAGHGSKAYHVTPDLCEFDRVVQGSLAVAHRNAYEVLVEGQRTKAYFDIEYFGKAGCAEAADAFEALMRAVRDAVRANAPGLVGIHEGELRVMVLDGSRDHDDGERRKFSCHVILDGVAFDGGATDPHLRYFVERALPPSLLQLVPHLAEHIPASAAIDMKVYGRHQNFRMVGSCKRGTHTPLRMVAALCDTDDRRATFLTLVEGLPSAAVAAAASFATTNNNATTREKRARPPEEDRVRALQMGLQTVLRMWGDAHSEVQHLARITDDDLRFQCNHYGHGRPCLISNARHENNNCLLFAKPLDPHQQAVRADGSLQDAYRIKYNCPSPSCQASAILGELTWNPAEGSFACRLFFPPHLLNEPVSAALRRVPVDGSAFGSSGEGRKKELVFASTAADTRWWLAPPPPAPPPEVEAEAAEEETYDHINPRPLEESDNYYPMVKQRFERYVFQLDEPVGFAFLGYQAHDRRIQILKRAELLHHFEATFFYDDSAAPVPFVKAWLRDPRKRKKLRIVYEPTSSGCGEHEYNSWGGFYADRLPAVAEADVDELVRPLLEHLLHVCANGKADDQLYLLRWLAQIVRHPNEKTQVALFFYGVEGCGKNLVLDLMQAVLGQPNGFQTASPERDIFGTFVTAFDKALLIQTDEVKRCHDYENLFKDYVTGETVRSEHKGKDARTVVNRANFVFTSNTEGAFRISPYDRRCVLFYCSGRFVGDDAYFGRLQPYRREPRVIRAFYQYLRDRVDLPAHYQFQFHRPKTEFYREQQRLCISPLDQFLSSLVVEHSARTAVMSFRQPLLWRMFQSFLEASGERFDGRQNSFTKAVLRRRGITREPKGQLYVLDLPTLKEGMIAGHAFDEDATWLLQPGEHL